MSGGDDEETRGSNSDLDRVETIAHQEGMSPYATGGGGVTFERKVAVQYLAHLMVGDGAIELGDGRSVVSVAFQQAPDHPVDDLVVSAARSDESEPSLVLAVGVRRAPKLIQSDEPTQKLIRQFVQALINAPTDGPEHLFALVVAGSQPQAEQLARLTKLAATQMDPTGFFHLVRTPKELPAKVIARLNQFEALVKKALIDLGIGDVTDASVQQRTWELLARLSVLMPRLESPNEMDWATVLNTLIPIAREADLNGALRLRDRLVALADEYPSNSAAIDLTLLRRHAHVALNPMSRRNQQGWQALDHLHEQALASVRQSICSGAGVHVLQLDRSEANSQLLAAISQASAVIVHGESGVGKSALALFSATAAATADTQAMQALCINLRQLPRSTLSLESSLGCPLATLLREFSAPQRVLIIDGADAIAEGMVDEFRYLVDSASKSDVKVVAITSSDNRQIVHDAIMERFGEGVTEYAVAPLTDEEIDEVVEAFPELNILAANPRSRDLLRRPVVIDLLVRGGVSGLPLNDADAMHEVWTGLVLRRGPSDRGTPDTRENVLLTLANLELMGGSPLDVIRELNPTALDGLRHDGLLRTSADDRFKIGPEFAHDEVRRYAIARLLLSDDDPTTKILAASAPRWALGAARLACQALLASPDTSARPLHGRLVRLQATFDALIDAGYGERWGDVPGEALLTMGDPGPILRDTWPQLQSDHAENLKRLVRIVGQRQIDEKGFVNIVAVEPIVTLLLNDTTPWRSGEYAEKLLRDWLRAHVIAQTPSGHPLRIDLREQLVRACADADRRLAEERAAAAVARATQSSEEIEKEREFIAKNRALFTEIGYSRRRRERPEVPSEITDEIVVELLALLGPDIGDDGEAILRRVAEDAPWYLAPAVEEFLTGRALASFRRGLLADLTMAYYIDDDANGSGFNDRGIRDHHARSFGVTPLASPYRGPFMPLFQTDFRNGVGVLNRMLNHAARVRATTPAKWHDIGDLVDESSLSDYQNELGITDRQGVYLGDDHVWRWYRGTGVGPYPCMSALQALERICDQFVEIGIPLATLVGVMLESCENLAMVGLIVGLLVRHLEKVEKLLDPYLAEPLIWHNEFTRMVHENSGLAADSEGLVGLERRNWSLREAAMMLVLRADEERVGELRAIGDLLVESVRRLISGSIDEVSGTPDEAVVREELATVRAWASALNRDTYQAVEHEDGVYIQIAPPTDVVRVLERGNEDIQRAQEAARLIVSYYIEPKRGVRRPLSNEELTADLATARALLEQAPGLSVGDPWDAPTAVAATVLEAHFLRGANLPKDDLTFAAETVVRVGERIVPTRKFESEETYFEQAADRSAARALSLLLLPAAAPLRATIDGADGSGTFERVLSAGINLAHAITIEVRLNLARGLDRVWDISCAGDRCHHEVALQLAVETMRDCVLGEWDVETGARHTILLDDPAGDSLAGIDDNAIRFTRLDAAIRALAPAATTDTCVSTRARDLLIVLFQAQRRALLAYEQDMDSRGSHALVSARALLTLAANGDDAPIYEHIDAYADNSALLGAILLALSAAAEETTSLAATARRVWPAVIRHVLGFTELGHKPFRDRYYGDISLAALMPNAGHEFMYLYREPRDKPIVWWDPAAWQTEIDAWIPMAVGNGVCVDHFISFLGALSPQEQVRIGLPRVATLVLANPAQVADRSFLISTWLVDVHSVAVDHGVSTEWQRVVDALVVAGVNRLAPYSE